MQTPTARLPSTGDTLADRLLVILADGPHSLAQINNRLPNRYKGAEKTAGLTLLERLGLATKRVIRFDYPRRPVTIWTLTPSPRENGNGHNEHNGHSPKLTGVLGAGGRR